MTSSDVPVLDMAAFSGPLDLLVQQARVQAIDLATLSIREVINQFAIALEAALERHPLPQLGDWVVLASWLVLLRSRLLLPTSELERIDAERDASVIRDRAVRRERLLQATDALERRPRLGRDVFGRGRQSELGSGVSSPQRFSSAADLVVACSTMLSELERKSTRRTRVEPPVFWTAQDASARMMGLLGTLPPGSALAAYLPESRSLHGADGMIDNATSTWPVVRAAVASTLIAGLELMKQGVIEVEQRQPLSAISIYPCVSRPLDRESAVELDGCSTTEPRARRSR